jgi:hypothetical protein
MSPNISFKPWLIAALWLLCGALSAQTAGISGRVVAASSGAVLPYANIALMALPDSAYVAAAASGEDGQFTLEALRPGTYLLQATMLGYERHVRPIELKAGQRVLLGDISLEEKAILLGEVQVAENRIPIRILNDTIEYDAAAFPTREDAVVEDLLKKLPGLEVDRQGQVKAMGQEVKEVLVDGKPFFGEDPLIATRNLPASIVDKVQVFDKKSEQAEFPQIDDGNTTKALNLSLKSDAKNGQFGRLAAGGGTDERFQLNGNFNRFSPNTQLSVLGSGNNINESGFSIGELLSSGAGLVEGGDENGNVNIRISNASAGRPGGGGGQPGIARAWSGGINFRESGWKKAELAGSYFYSDHNTFNAQELLRQNLAAEGPLEYRADSRSDVALRSHRLNLRLDYKIDSLHSLLFRPELNWQRQQVAQEQAFLTQGTDTALVSEGNNTYFSDQTAPSLQGSLLFRKKFRQQGRAFSLNAESRYQSREGEDGTFVANRFFNGGGPDFLLDQRIAAEQSSGQHSLRASYTEPLRRRRYLELHYGWRQAAGRSSREAFDLDEASGRYDLANPLFTNAFDSRFTTHEGGMNFKIEKLKYNYTLGLSVQDYRLESTNLTADTAIQQQAINFFPIAVFKYNFSGSKRFSAAYRGATEQPSVSQLQPLPDLSDPQYIRYGNPGLQPQFAHRLQLNFTDFDSRSLRSFFANGLLAFTANAIVNDITLLEGGRQEIRPRNGLPAYTGMGFIGWGIPVKKWNADFGISTNLLYNQRSNYVDGIANLTHTLQATQVARASYYRGELLDLGVSASITYQRADYALQPILNTQFFRYQAGADAQLRLPFGLSLRTDLSYFANTGGSGLYNQRSALLNASLVQELLQKRATLQLRAFDLLRQNLSLARNTTASYLEDVSSTVLGQYWMLSFAWRVKRFGK